MTPDEIILDLATPLRPGESTRLCRRCELAEPHVCIRLPAWPSQPLLEEHMPAEATALYLSAETRDAVRFAEEQVDVVYDLAIIERMLKRKPVFAVPCQDCEWKKGHP